MGTIELEKSVYSEWVIRNSLYWMSAMTPWELAMNETHWVIELDDHNKETRQELNRLLNDYSLREKIMSRTEEVRNNIIEHVLSDIQARLNK